MHEPARGRRRTADKISRYRRVDWVDLAHPTHVSLVLRFTHRHIRLLLRDQRIVSNPVEGKVRRLHEADDLGGTSYVLRAEWNEVASVTTIRITRERSSQTR